MAMVSLAAMIAGSVLAQNYAVDWHKVAAGGGASTNAQYAVNGTIGQPDTGHLAGGTYAMDGGFWAFAAAVQNPGAPLLTIRLTVTDSIAISWPSSSTGFVLQSSTHFAATNWTMVPLAPSDDGSTKTVIVTKASGYQFFRLAKP